MFGFTIALHIDRDVSEEVAKSSPQSSYVLHVGKLGFPRAAGFTPTSHMGGVANEGVAKPSRQRSYRLHICPSHACSHIWQVLRVLFPWKLLTIRNPLPSEHVCGGLNCA